MNLCELSGGCENEVNFLRLSEIGETLPVNSWPIREKSKYII